MIDTLTVGMISIHKAYVTFPFAMFCFCACNDLVDATSIIIYDLYIYQSIPLYLRNLLNDSGSIAYDIYT